MYTLVVEDDELLSDFIEKTLKLDGHRVDVIHDGLKGFERAQSKNYDSIVLDVMLPHKNGYEICSDLRRLGVTTPIIFLSANSSESEKIAGLDSGADDYLTKPFSYKELQARIRAITRRPSTVSQSKLQLADLVMDPSSRQVTRDNTIIALRPKEYELLEYLLQNQNIALSKQRLLNDVWGVMSESSSNRLEVHIRNLRKKIDKNHQNKLIKTVRNIGYKISG